MLCEMEPIMRPAKQGALQLTDLGDVQKNQQHLHELPRPRGHRRCPYQHVVTPAVGADQDHFTMLGFAVLEGHEDW